MDLSDLPVVTKRPTVAAAEEILGMYFPALDHGFVAPCLIQVCKTMDRACSADNHQLIKRKLANG